MTSALWIGAGVVCSLSALAIVALASVVYRGSVSGRGRIESTPIIDGMRFLLATFVLTRPTASAPRGPDISPDTYSTSLRNRTLGVDSASGVERAADGDRATYFQIAVYDQRPMHRKRAMKRIVSTAFA
ncbi:hypothetical protein KTE45_01790 [Burkholderia multivorans]|uniref:hypothetical protein n=1 Tax=Burkholderia multivorans TaxID=87883 RepID=UPI001C25661E|nr:hypothetical protein [Burkholderia multivorans]MBU9517188.1 hypothetical protein [Burkholderia multivorans]